MSNEKIKNYQIFSVIFIFILGTLLHFTYDLSNGNQIIATFSSINESVWEHLKLLYFPIRLKYQKMQNAVMNSAECTKEHITISF